ncbi:MAG: hypothetical protein ABW179_05185 [Methylobacterium sp.]
MLQLTRFLRLGLGGQPRPDDGDGASSTSMGDLLRRLRRRQRARTFY